MKFMLFIFLSYSIGLRVFDAPFGDEYRTRLTKYYIKLTVLGRFEMDRKLAVYSRLSVSIYLGWYRQYRLAYLRRTGKLENWRTGELDSIVEASLTIY